MELLEILKLLELLELMELMELLEKGDSLTDWLTDNLKSRDASASKKVQKGQLISKSFHFADIRLLNMSKELIKSNIIFRNGGGVTKAGLG